MKAATRIKRMLTKAGIVTIADLKKYAADHPKVDRFGQTYIDSNYGTLKDLVGEDAAMWMLNELAIQQCCGAPTS